MGREIKRVALDFDHPLREVWPGFIRQAADFPPCTACCWGGEPSGLTREAYAVDNTFYAHQITWSAAGDALAWGDKLGQVEVDKLVAEMRIGMRTHWTRIELPEPWEMDEGHPIRYRFERNDKPAPTADEVNAVNRGGGGLFHDFGHDAISRWILVRHRCELLGIPYECPTCKGHQTMATDEERAAEEAAAEAWRPTEPPAGDGYQLWETVSEGSPISPVFALPGDLAVWMTQNKCTVNGPMATVDAALRFIQAGWAPSFVSGPEIGFTDGMTAAGRASTLDGGQ